MSNLTQRAVPAKKAATKTASRNAGDDDWMKSGSDIETEVTKIGAEKQRRSEQRKRTGGIDPDKIRFWLNAGDSAEVIILDKTADTKAFYEHNMKKDGKFGHHEACPAEWENCPLCKQGDQPGFIQVYTILDLRGYEKDGKTIPYSRRLLTVTQQQHSMFKKILKAAEAAHGTARGTVLLLEREVGDKTPRIGTPQLLKSGSMFAHINEATILRNYKHPAIIGQQKGEVIVPANGLLQPYDYVKLFPKPSGADIAARWGFAPQAGSDAEFANAAIDTSYAYLGELADGDETSPEGIEAIDTLNARAAELEIDVNDYLTWTEAGQAMDDAGLDVETGSGGDKTHAELGADADADELSEDGSYAKDVLEAKASDHGLDPNGYPTWAELGEVIDGLENDGPPNGMYENDQTMAYAGSQADTGDTEWESTLNERAEAAGLDPMAYPTWEALGVAIDEYEAANSDVVAEVEATWGETGAQLDAEGATENEVFADAAAELGIDPNDYGTWEEAGEAMDNATNAVDETYAEIGARADAGGDTEAETILTEAADALGIDINSRPTWKSLGELLDNPTPPPATKVASRHAGARENPF